MSDSVLTATRLLMAVSESSIASVDESITIPQFRVLVVLQSRGPRTLAGLADALDVGLPAVAHTVDRMAASGLVTRARDVESPPEVVLRLTDRGNGVCTEVTEQRRARIAEIVSRIPEDQIARLGDVAEAFNEAGGEPPATEVHADWR